MNAGRTVADFSRTVRESSLKRFRRVAAGDEEWSPAPGALSFADLLKHLVDADRWLLSFFDGAPIPRAVIAPGEARGREWSRLLADLVALGEEKARRFESLRSEDLGARVVEPQVLGETTLWWLIFRGSLDHEIHHRGALQLSLRLRYGS